MAHLTYLRDVVTLELDPTRCNGCGTCLDVCPHAVFAVDDGAARIVERDACMECGACAHNCPTDALTVQAGVGCAAAVINGALGWEGACCCTVQPAGQPAPDDGPTCGPGCC